MVDSALIGTVALIHFLAVITPGPDFIMIIKNSLLYSRNIGLWTVMGLGLGIITHIIYCMAGLAIVISKSMIVFNVMKLLGAGYLIYIGFRSIFSKSSAIHVNALPKSENISPLKAIQIGFLTNVLNPKATLFFLSLFTFVVSPTTSRSTLIILSMVIFINTVLWFSVIALCFTQKKVQRLYNKYQGIFNKIFGCTLIGIGIKLAFIQN